MRGLGLHGQSNRRRWLINYGCDELGWARTAESTVWLRARSLVSGAETWSSGSVWSTTMVKWLWMRWAKLNTHSNASGLNNLNTCSRRNSRNGWHGISGAHYDCRCRRCCFRAWVKSIGDGRRWLFCSLGLAKFLKNALHIVEQWVVVIWYTASKVGDMRAKRRTLSII